MHELEDERPIPLGRAAVAVPPAPAAEPPRRPIPAPAPTPPTPRPAAHIERTRAQAGPEIGEPAPRPAVAVATAAPRVVVEPPVVGRAAPGPRTARREHPMAGLGGFRMEVELVQDGGRARDVGRFIAAYIVVIALVLGLVVAFLALTAHVGSGGA